MKFLRGWETLIYSNQLSFSETPTMPLSELGMTDTLKVIASMELATLQ